MMRAIFPIWVLLFSCGYKSIEIEEAENLIVSVDEDRDGFTADVDCDDTEYSVHPNAIETCDEPPLPSATWKNAGPSRWSLEFAVCRGLEEPRSPHASVGLARV